MKYIEFGPEVPDSVPFKDISYLELRPEQKHLCSVGRGQYEKHFYEIILEFGLVVQE